MVTTGFDVTIKIVSAGTCTTTSDQISLSGGTCTAIPYIDTYSMSGNVDMIDYTAFGDKIKKVVPGFPGSQLQFSGGLDLTDTNQLAFWNMLTCSTKVTRLMRVYENKKCITFRGYCSGVQLGSSVGGKSTFSATIDANLLPKTCTAT